MLNLFLRPCEKSSIVIAPTVNPWGSPLVLVAKKDGTTQWAVDYRELNKHMLPDAYPTPCLSHIVESLVGSKVFSSLNATQALHNVPIDESSQDATAFVCMYGLFKFLRMPFGLRNIGVVYCRLVAQIMDNLGLESVAHATSTTSSSTLPRSRSTSTVWRRCYEHT